LKHFNILVVKETREGESRVSLVPRDIKKLIEQGHHVFFEHRAGEGAQFFDQDYQNAGAVIRYISDETILSYQEYFKDIDLIVRAKRPERSREILESKTISKETIMIGALDPLEKQSPHIQEYHEANIIAYSIDQLHLPPDDPMNLLAVMSKIAGKLALLDAIKHFDSIIKKIVIIGFGMAGRAAFDEAVKQELPIVVVLTNPNSMDEIKSRGHECVLLDKNAGIKEQQAFIKQILLNANIVITSARSPNQPAPLLIPTDTLQSMQSGSVIVDLALSEGGNVEGSEHDKTKRLGNNIIVTNVSGYPKIFPHDASKLWSTVSFHFIHLLGSERQVPLAPC